ncbi:MAG: tetratricopeptide repeat protein [Rhodobacteraceae bacterium]|nr:tetratricopeptide repeat protein [Paracoccaceae bacterium]
MSNSDSFIEEVSEELRKDRLFGFFRRYGWIVALGVVAIVGGAAWNEWRKAQETAEAQALGDTLLAAFEAENGEARAEVLAGLEVEGAAAGLKGLVVASDPFTADAEAALDELSKVEANAELDDRYRHLATLKRVLLAGATLSPAERIEALTPLTAPGAPYRLLAEEQIALAEIDAGDTDSAIARLRALAEDGTASSGLRRRAGQLIIALGGDLDAS